MVKLPGCFFEGVVGFEQVALSVILDGSRERNEDVGELRIVFGLFDDSVGVLEEV